MAPFLFACKKKYLHRKYKDFQFYISMVQNVLKKILEDDWLTWLVGSLVMAG